MLRSLERRVRRLEEEADERAGNAPTAILVLPDNFRWFPGFDEPPRGKHMETIPDVEGFRKYLEEWKAWELSMRKNNTK